MAVVDGADGPAHDKPRVEIQDGGEIQLAAAADDELCRVADPPLIGRGRLELTIEQIGSHGLVVIAHRRALEPFTDPCFQSVFLHQPDDALPAHAYVLLEQILVNRGLPYRRLLASNEARTKIRNRRSRCACADSGR